MAETGEMMATGKNKPEILIQRAEGLAILSFALYMFAQFDLDWTVFILLFFTIDLFMIGYAFNKKFGAYTYNLGHTLVVPAFLWLMAWEFEQSWIMTLSLIWFSHIGFDRALGYGLKLNKGFEHTHLGKIGKLK